MRAWDVLCTMPLLPIDIPPVPDAVEEDPLPLNVIADAIVPDSHTPLADADIGQLPALMRIRLQRFERLKHPPVRLGVEAAEIATEAIGADDCKAGHTRRASPPGVL
jgi:hypothetical protein